MTMPVVVVGGGNAGLAAAVTLGEAGVPTVLFDSAERLGGQLAWSSGHFSAAGTYLQRARGIVDSAEAHAEEVMRISNGHADEVLVGLATTHAAEMVAWLGDLGFPFGAEVPARLTSHAPYSVPRIHWGGEHLSRGGLPLRDTLVAALERTQVRVSLATRLVDIEFSADQAGGVRVSGVVTDGPRGVEVTETNSLILATGGYGANRSMLTRLHVELTDDLIGCLPHARGEGHALLERVGVPIIRTELHHPTLGIIEDPRSSSGAVFSGFARVNVDPTGRDLHEIWVNDDSQRFIAEDTQSPYERERALLEQPGRRMSVIWDTQALLDSPAVIVPDWSRDRIEASAADPTVSWLHRASGLMELAESLQLDGVALAATVDQYNNGFDEEDPFGRLVRPRPIDAPPFYGVKVRSGLLQTRGGPPVDSNLQPIRSDGTTLGGCYVVGEALGAGAFHGDSFAGGMTVGPALTLGRLIGHRLAAG